MISNQSQFINDICVALDQTKCSDNTMRNQAETYIKEVSDFHSNFSYDFLFLFRLKNKMAASKI